MKNSDMPATPCEIKIYGEESMYYPDGMMSCGGLTKREMFAMAAMNGIMSNSNDRYTYEQLAGHAVAQADALLSELEKCK